MIALLADHLWQSTLVAAGAAVLALTFRADAARVRYLVWLATSLKFLVPFAALVAIGRRFGLRPPSAEPVHADLLLTTVIETVAGPFSTSTTEGAAAATAAASSGLFALAPPALLAIWGLGVSAVLAVWVRRWRQVAALVRAAVPLDDPRVAAMLARLERTGSRRPRLRAVTCDTRLEPGVFGIWRPVLVWPRGIAGRLRDDQLEAILAHELCHVARRDNLTAALHAGVQAVFWFHPLVWWLGARLVEERERACDEAVLAEGRAAEGYAESILETCRHALEAPAPCMAGVSGADLKRRLERIMSSTPARALPGWKKAALAACAAAALAGPVAVGVAAGPQAQAQVPAAADRPSFEVASVKPNTSAGPGPIRVGFPGNNRFNVTNMPLRELIRFAYEVQPFQMTGGPGWLDAERFDVTATTTGNPGPAVMRRMLQSLLAERFNLAVHTETRELAIYEMVVARADGRLGEKLRPAGPDCTPLNIPAGMPTPPPPPPGPGAGAAGRGGPDGPGCPMIFGPGFMSARRTTMAQLARSLAPRVRRIIVDKTGLTGFYDADLEFTPDAPVQQIPGGPPFPEPSGDAPSIYTALQEQLGLKLDSARGPVEMLVIDRVEALIPD